MVVEGERAAGSPTFRYSIGVLAYDSSELDRARDMLRLLAVTGWPIDIVVWSPPTPPVEHIRTTVLTAAPPAAPRPAGRMSRLRELARRQPTGPVIDATSIPEEILRADVVVVLDDVVRRGLDARRESGAAGRRGSWAELSAAVVRELATRPTVKAGDLPALCQAIPTLEPHALSALERRALCRGLIEGGHWQALRTLVHRLRSDGEADALERATWVALGTLSDVALGEIPHDLVERTRTGLEAADLALSAGADPTGALVLVAVVLRSHFHRSMHTASETSPLIEEPERYLSPLTTSAGLRLHNPGERAVARSGEQTRAVVLPGAYPNFADQLTRVLSGSGPVTVVDLGAVDSRFRNTEMDVDTLTQLWHVGDTRGSGAVRPALMRATESWNDADLVVADWADKGAVLASLTVAPTTRLVLRVHGVDSLSAWIHLVDWRRVDAVVFVSAHLQAAVRGMLGDRLAGIEQHVVPHAIDVSHYSATKTSAARHTLGMVGWAQRVKDPLWAVELLGRLRQGDPAWRLRLIGPDFAASGSSEDAAYARRFRDTVLREELLDAIDFVGVVPKAELGDAFPDIGFALSTSRRESWHVGAMELMASGAVPVVRDWPLYASLSGAAGVFPASAVVASTEDAAAMVRSYSDAGRWECAAAQARSFVEERYGPVRVEPLLERALLGREARRPT